MTRTLMASDVPLDSFHDCHVRGVAWCAERYEVAIELDYIMRWIEPKAPAERFRFIICKANLVFVNADSLNVELAWGSDLLTCQIGSVRVADARESPTGMVVTKYVFEFSEPDGGLSLWSTGYSLSLLSEPVISDVPRLAT